jgi:hypothetical protein
LHVFLVSKPLGRCFSPGLIALAEIEQGRKTKNNPHTRPPIPPTPRVHVEPFPWLHEIPLSKIVCHQFLLGQKMVTRSFGKKNFMQSSWTLNFSF